MDAMSIIYLSLSTFAMMLASEMSGTVASPLMIVVTGMSVEASSQKV